MKSRTVFGCCVTHGLLLIIDSGHVVAIDGSAVFGIISAKWRG
jgi:hypothetical protein